MALTGRNLQRISHTDYDPVVITTSGKRAATVVQSNGGANPGQAFAVDYILREGATLYQPDNNWRYTVESVSGNSVILKQPAVATSGSISPWYTSIADGGYPSSWVYPALSNQLPPANRRDRGGDHLDQYAGVAGVLVPDAAHYIYLSPVDEVGNPDYYIYFCTLVPDKNGLHLFTKDPVVGSFLVGSGGVHIVDDMASRVRRLEGALRAGRSSSSLSQDHRLADLVARFRALEDWANRVGTNSPPTPGNNATYTESDIIAAGDSA